MNYGGTLKLVGFRSLPYCQNWDIPRLLHCSLTPTRLRDADPGVGGSGAWEAAAWNTKPHISRMHRLTHIYIHGHLSCLLTLLKIRQHRLQHNGSVAACTPTPVLFLPPPPPVQIHLLPTACHILSPCAFQWASFHILLALPVPFIEFCADGQLQDLQAIS